jgi:hypothetical protein
VETVTTVETKEKSTSSFCFPGDAQVQVHGMGLTPIANLRLGDRVLVSPSVYEPVLGFLHVLGAKPGVRSSFMTIRHELGEFRASANHIIFVVRGESVTDKVAAKLEVGDRLSAARSSTIVGLRWESAESGMYAPLTATGTIIVDGVLASTYGSSSISLPVPHSAAHVLFLPVRYLGSLFSYACSGSILGSSWFCRSNKAAFDGEVHPFVNLLTDRLRLHEVQKMIS